MAVYDDTHDVDTDDVYPEAARGTLSTLINVMGGAASLALIAGIGVWGYQLVVRDVSGIPVVRALEGPMREAPDDPGGLQADNQGLAVNAVAANGSAEKAADRLVLAPPPVQLSAEDRPMARPDGLAGDNIAPEDVVRGALPNGPATPEVQPPKPEPEGEMASAPTTNSLDDIIRGVLKEVDETSVKPEAAVLRSDVTGEEARPKNGVTGPGPATSLRPKARPAGLSASAATNADVVTRAAFSLDVSPENLVEGTMLAQLGAYDTPEIAREEWDRLFVQFTDIMTGKQRVIQESSSGGRTFYRLRAAGFEDRREARRFCAVMMAERADCISVPVR